MKKFAPLGCYFSGFGIGVALCSFQNASAFIGTHFFPVLMGALIIAALGFYISR
jgi:hypothetical protein